MLITGEESEPGTNGALATRTDQLTDGATGAWICTVEVDDIAETERAAVAAGGTRSHHTAPGCGPGSRDPYRPV